MEVRTNHVRPRWDSTKRHAVYVGDSMNVFAAILAVYLGGVLFFGGILLGDEMKFKHPEYVEAALTAVVWPIVVLFAAYHWSRSDR